LTEVALRGFYIGGLQILSPFTLLKIKVPKGSFGTLFSLERFFIGIDGSTLISIPQKVLYVLHTGLLRFFWGTIFYMESLFLWVQNHFLSSVKNKKTPS